MFYNLLEYIRTERHGTFENGLFKNKILKSYVYAKSDRCILYNSA